MEIVINGIVKATETINLIRNSRTPYNSTALPETEAVYPVFSIAAIRSSLVTAGSTSARTILDMLRNGLVIVAEIF